MPNGNLVSDRVINWTQGDLDEDGDSDGVTMVKTGPATFEDIDFTTSLLEASANVALEIEGILYISGGFAFRKGAATFPKNKSSDN